MGSSRGGQSAWSSLIRARPLLAFVVLAYGITWLFRIPLAASTAGLIPLALPRTVLQFAGDFGPLVAATVVVAAPEGRAGVRELFGRVLCWRVGWGWYALALFGPVALFLVSAVVSMTALGAPVPDWGGFGRWEELPFLGPVATWVFLVVVIGFGEEVGWRGFVQPHLQARHSALAAAVVVGVFWVFWHAPTFVFDAAFSDMSLLFTIGWALLVIAGSIVLAWLYNGTGGSLLIPILFHGTQDFTMASAAARGQELNLVWAVVFLTLTIMIVRIAGPRYLTRSYTRHPPWI
ncbi:CPBP family intramembrane glutamic endopeptidase [Arthrobacter sp. NPDC092385]|uniref:CPBP family intramembrane glutamic endopeptidase n=1 Tax=Arthrobacter sp. NPDC092385 TaxID=3363943 RepID=UPI0037F5CD46